MSLSLHHNGSGLVGTSGRRFELAMIPKMYRAVLEFENFIGGCRCPVKFFSREIFLLPVFLPVSTPSCMRRNGYIMNGKYFILGYIQHIVDSYRYFYIIFLKLSFNNKKSNNTGDPWFGRHSEEKFYFREKLHVTPFRLGFGTQ